MKNRKIRVAIRHDMTDKAGELQRRSSGTGWENAELTIDQFMEHVGKGFPFTHQFAGGHRKKQNFQSAEVLIADIDEGLSVEEALEHPFIKGHASFLYTTPSHSEASNRFRIIFLLERRIFDSEGYEALYETLMSIIPTDPSAKSCAQFFFGNSKAEFHWIGKSIPDRKITEMINEGMEKRIRASTPPLAAQLEPDTHVRVKNKGLMPIGALAAKTSIHCPFGTHKDENASAFIKINNDGVRGVECRTCGHSGWTGKFHARDDSFGYFDQMVVEYAGQANSHFEYLGLTKFDHDLEISMEKSNFHLANSKLLSIGEILPGINLIKSPKGSGKTHVLGELISTFKNPDFLKFTESKDQRIILIGHRQSLIRESAAKLGLECYLDTGNYDTRLDRSGGKTESRSQTTLKPQYYAICLDSLHTRIRPNYENYGVVIIDESEQVFSHFFSEHMKYPTSNFEILSNLIKKAKYVFCLDADLDTITLSGIISCLSYSKDNRDRQFIHTDLRHHQKLYCHLNTYKPPERSLDLFVSKNHLLEDLRKNVSEGKRCYVTSNSRKFIQGQFEAFSKAFVDKKFKMIVSDLGDDHQIGTFLKNIKTEILKYDTVMSSPSIGTGIDITFPNEEARIDCVYGFFEAGINTHFDIDQQLGRVRNPGQVKVWINPKKERKSTDREVILQELLHGDEIKGLRYYLDAGGAHSSTGDHPFLDLLTEVLAVRRRSMNRLRDNFITHKEKNGWLVVRVEGDEVAKRRGSIIGKAGRAQRRKATTARLLSAADIGFKGFLKLKELKDTHRPLTDEQKASQEKYWLKSFYNRDVTADLILLDDDRKTREKIRLLETVINPTLKFRYYKEISSSPEILVSYDAEKIDKEIIKRAVFLRELFSVAGIYDSRTFSFVPDATYGTANLIDFINLIQKHKERLAQLFNKEINDHLVERPTVQVRTLLRLVGLNQVQVKANRGGNRGGSTYKIDAQAYQRMLDIIDHRAKRKESTAEQVQLEAEMG